MSDMYQVTAECAYVTVDTPQGRMKTLLYKGAPLSADTPELKHLLAGGLAAKVGGTPPEPEPVETPPAPPEPSSPATEPDGDAETRRAAARAKLAEIGGVPDGRHSEDVWVEYAVTQGLDRTEAQKAGKEELRKVLAK